MEDETPPKTYVLDETSRAWLCLKAGAVGYAVGLILGLWLIPLAILAVIVVYAWYENR